MLLDSDGFILKLDIAEKEILKDMTKGGAMKRQF